MEAFAPLLSLAAIWLPIGLPIAKLSEAAKKKAAGKAAALGAPAKAAASAPAPVQQAQADTAASRDRILQPTVRITEHDDSIYRGSLNAVTGEGYDPCHEAQFSSQTRAEAAEPAPAPAAPAFRLSWEGSDIVRGFVMGEILNRKQRGA